MIATLGNGLQICALVLAAIAALLLLAGVKSQREKLVNLGYVLVFGNTIALTACIAILLICFFTGNFTIAYIVSNYPYTDDPLRWLFLIAGVWAGRQGSLLFWTWCISVYAAVVAWKRMGVTDDISNAALAVTEIVIVFFAGALVFSSSNNPFLATAAEYLNSDGSLVSKVGGMNPLLLHWAMALHPPATFIGYAGCTIPFAYALAALIVGDTSARWVELCQRIAVFAFIFLTIGMSLGAVWAYVVLGWGGFWGWDAVENASLFSWLTSVAMIHSFTMYRKRNCLKRWSMSAATITFIFVVLGTFITRSGLVQSVHAFSEDEVSTFFFLGIMVAAALAYLLLLLYRNSEIAEEDEIESMFSKNGSYWLTDLIMIMAGLVAAYMTVSSSLPSWLPLGGQVVAAGAYNAVARPVGTLFALMMAVCPMLGWKKTDGKRFAQNMRVPAIAGAVVFAGLMVVFFTKFVPTYNSIVAEGGDAATTYTEQGPAAYYFGLTIVALLAGALLFTTSLYLLIRGVKGRMANKGENPALAVFNLFRHSPAQAGGYLTHLGVAVALVGLVGSSMYVREATVNLAATEGQSAIVGSYELVYTGQSDYTDSEDDAYKQIELDVFDATTGESLGHVSPSLEVSAANSGQQTLHASVITFPSEDLFVAFQGLNADDTLSISVKVNPLILLNWIGGGIAVLGIILAFLPRRATPLLAADERERAEAAERAAARAERAAKRAQKTLQS